jgi:CRISPR-associated protein Cas1
MLEEVAAPANLKAAWLHVRRKRAAPGVDGITVAAYARDAGRHLARMRRDMLAQRYRPHPARALTTPKRDSGRRQIAVLTVHDRVAQRAALQVVETWLERVFEPCSYAYRPGRSVNQAIYQIERWRDAGYQWVVDADIEECFDSLDHALLMKFLAAVVPDGRVCDLMRMWIEMAVLAGVELRFPTVGVLQGGVVSPALCNLYLDRLDKALQKAGHKVVRYADDFLILCRTRARAESAKQQAAAILASMNLRLSVRKTQVVSFDRGFKYVGTLFVCSMMLPSERTLVATPAGRTRVVYTSGYPSAPKPSVPLRLTSQERRLRELQGLAAREYSGGHITSVGAALLEAERRRAEQPGREVVWFGD